MNERIQELRKQACQWVVDNHQRVDPKNLSQAEIDQRYLMYEQKFAELIVKECAEVAGCNSHVSGFTLGDLIKEHFGVEE